MPEKTSNSNQEANTDVLLAAYSEVCRSYHDVDDFRGKLLGALPVVSGAGGILLLTNAGTLTGYLGPIGLFGLAVTVGLGWYELRGLRNCGRLTELGKELEAKLHLKPGQFSVLEKELETKWGAIDLPKAASWTVYGATLAGWLFVACVGFFCPT